VQLSRKALNSRWAWTTGAAAAALLVLNLADAALRAGTGYGTVDLQGVASGWGVRAILDRWTSPPDAALAGFLLGFDYLFMPLYAAALFCGSIAALDRFAPEAGGARRIMALLAFAPVAGAIFDGCENALQIVMMTRGPTDMLASFALEATAAKYAGIAVGIVLSLAGLVGLFWKKTKRPA